MNKLIFSIILFSIFSSAFSQNERTGKPGMPENENLNTYASGTSAVILRATRLFKDKDDLTSVILVIPADSIVEVISSDNSFINVIYEGNNGFIDSNHARINKQEATAEVVSNTYAPQNDSNYNNVMPAQNGRISRFDYLDNKYGTSLAEKIYAHKIWKGMKTEMVKDSWGSPQKIRRVISDNAVKDEWYYNSTLLYFQNSTLVEWKRIKD